MNFIENIVDTLSRALKWLKHALSDGVNITNQIKDIVDSPYVEGIVQLTGTKLDDAALAFLKTAIATWLKDSKVIDQTIDDSDDAIKQGSIAIAQMNEARATTLTGLSAYASTVVAKLQGNDLPIQQAIAGVVAAYQHPESIA